MKIYNPTGFSSSLTGSFSGSVKGTLTATGNIIPDVSGAYDIGSTAFPFKDLYITQNSLKFIDDNTGTEIGRISVNSNTGDIKLLNTKNLTEEQKATLTAENVGAEALSPVSASALWVSQSISPGHTNTSIGHTNQKFHTVHTQYVSASSTAISGDLTVGGKVTAQEFHTEFVSASIIYESGSTKFGNSSDDVHSFTGNVGIGTANPDSKLTVEDSSAGFSFNVNHISTFAFGTTNGKRIASITNGSGDRNGLQLGYDAVDGTGIVAGATEVSGSGIDFYTYDGSNWDSRMRISKSGNIGIGTDGPDSLVTLVGTGDSYGNGLRWRHRSTSNYYEAIHGTSNILYWGYNGNTFLQMNTGNSFNIISGNVGIGTTDPYGTLTLNYTGDNLAGSYFGNLILNATNSSTWSRIRLDRAGTSRYGIGLNPDDKFIISNLNVSGTGEADDTTFVITNANNVGIGTAAPETSLSIRSVTHPSWGNLSVFDNTSATTGVGGFISLNGNKISTTNGAIFAKIGGIKENSTSGNEAGSFVIHTSNDVGTVVEKMRVNSGGQILTPYQPAFHARRSSTTPLAAGNYVVYDVAYFNRGNHYNTSTGVFTAPIAGVYIFFWSAIGSNTSDVYRYFLRLNGSNNWPNSVSDIHLRQDTGATGSEYAHNGNRIHMQTLSANDQVSVYFTSDSSTPSYSGGDYLQFGGYLIG